MKPPEPPFYTVAQMAKMLGMKESTVMRHIRLGILKGKRIGRTPVIPVKTFEEQLLAEDEQPSKSRKLSATTRIKMNYNAMLRSLNNLDESSAKVVLDIQKIQKELPETPGPEKASAIQKLKDKYALLAEIEKAKNSKDEKIEKMSSVAYPGVKRLIGRKLEEIIAILETETGSGEAARPSDETSKHHHKEDDARRQQKAKKGDIPEGQQQAGPPTRETTAPGASVQARLFGPAAPPPRGQQHTKTKSVGGSGGQKPPEHDTSPEDDDGTEQ